MNAAKKFAGIIGWPVSQSLSPVMHNYWITEHGIDAAFERLAVPAEEFRSTIAELPQKGFAGLSVTIPHKEAAFAISDSHDDDALAAGAVNLLVFEEGTIHGRNTDIYGFSTALAESLGADAARAGPVAVLGAGGAARAVVLALLRNGAREIRIVNRTLARAEELMAPHRGKAAFSVVRWDEIRRALEGARLLVNTTSLGMATKEPLEVPLDVLGSSALVADIVYNPLETRLLKSARALGFRTMDGLGMLMHQGVPAFAAWFGVTPQVTPALRALLEEKLRG
jgi:shikimate dehydrogenase